MGDLDCALGVLFVGFVLGTSLGTALTIYLWNVTYVQYTEEVCHPYVVEARGHDPGLYGFTCAGPTDTTTDTPTDTGD